MIRLAYFAYATIKLKTNVVVFLSHEKQDFGPFYEAYLVHFGTFRGLFILRNKADVVPFQYVIQLITVYKIHLLLY